MSTYTYTGQLVVQDCISCGITFGVPPWWDNERRRDHERFYCPNGHSQHYTGKTEEQKLREQQKEQTIEAARAQRDYWMAEQQRERRSHAATKGQLTKARKRIGKRVCPNCNRSFPALAAHMASEHPEVASGG